MEFFAGAFLEADGEAEVYDHFGSGDVFGVDDLGFADEADAAAGYGGGGGFGGAERECRATMFHMVSGAGGNESSAGQRQLACALGRVAQTERSGEPRLWLKDFNPATHISQ